MQIALKFACHVKISISQHCISKSSGVKQMATITYEPIKQVLWLAINIQWKECPIKKNMTFTPDICL